MSESQETDPLWADPANWRFGVIYFCRQDPRIIVPKRLKAMGWTINFARPMALPVLALMIGIFAGTMAVAEGLAWGVGARVLLALCLLVLLLKVSAYLSRPAGRDRSGTP